LVALRPANLRVRGSECARACVPLAHACDILAHHGARVVVGHDVGGAQVHIVARINRVPSREVDRVRLHQLFGQSLATAALAHTPRCLEAMLRGA
jgi:hypothetical protein